MQQKGLLPHLSAASSSNSTVKNKIKSHDCHTILSKYETIVYYRLPGIVRQIVMHMQVPTIKWIWFQRENPGLFYSNILPWISMSSLSTLTDGGANGIEPSGSGYPQKSCQLCRPNLQCRRRNSCARYYTMWRGVQSPVVGLGVVRWSLVKPPVYMAWCE